MSFDLVLFGGTGDLAWRKLMPALFQAFRHGTLPEGGRIIAVARDELSHEQYRSLIQSRFDSVELAKRPTPDEFERFGALLHYLRMDLSKTDDYAACRHAARAQGLIGGDVCVHRASLSPMCASNRRLGLNGPPPAWC